MSLYLFELSCVFTCMYVQQCNIHELFVMPLYCISICCCFFMRICFLMYIDEGAVDKDKDVSTILSTLCQQ